MIALLRLDIYSHNVKITKIQPSVRKILIDFILTLGEYELRQMNKHRWDRVLKKLYATRTIDKLEYRIHRHSYNDFIKYMADYGIHVENMDVIHHVPPKADKVKFTVIDKRVPRDDQVGLIDYLSKDQHVKALTLQTGKGKFQPLNSMIKVPNGWKRMGDMEVGDRVVVRDGSVSMVNAIYPQGKQEIYKITFADGRSTECGLDHLWKIYYVNTSKNKRWRVVDTKEIMRLINMPNPRVYIPLIDSEKNSDIDLPMDPYTLGVIIGDGCTRAGITITKGDREIFDEVQKTLPATLKFTDVDSITKRIVSVNGGKNDFITILTDFGLMNKLSYEKFIPIGYLYGSTSQRLSLLQGLLDTDGTVQKSGSISYSTTSEKLAKQVKYLVYSLGGIAAIKQRITNYTYKDIKKQGRVCYEVDIRYKKPSELFRISRKLNRTNDFNQYSSDLKLRIKSVEYVGLKEAQCIAIDHPEHLYITDDFILTHNTFIANHAISRISERTVIIIKGMYVDRWLTDINETFNIDKGDMIVVRGTKDMMNVILLAQHKQLVAKIIIITNTTFRMFIDEYEANPYTNMYGCNPEDFFGLIGAGIRLIDEVHQDFHLNFKIDLYTNIKTTINLSATLNADNVFTNKMYALAYPPEYRPNTLGYDKYIAVKAYFYKLNDIRKIRHKQRGRSFYNHVVYEESIMKNPEVYKNYVNMIADITLKDFIEEWELGQRFIIFCSTKEFCTRLTAVLQRKFPNMDIGRYIGEDDAEVYKTSDIIVSTLKSAGTAVDIPGLKKALLTIAVGSRQANEQAVGRLRKLRDWPDVTPEFIYLVCSDIDKHVEYHKHKTDILSDKILSSKTFYTPYRI